jgi:hypothetical protein
MELVNSQRTGFESTPNVHLIRFVILLMLGGTGTDLVSFEETFSKGAHGSVVVEALSYKLEGRWFETR